MADLGQSLQQALQQIEVQRQQARDNRSILGEANYRELSEMLSASEASVRRQIARHAAQSEWERRMMAEFNRLRGAA